MVARRAACLCTMGTVDGSTPCCLESRRVPVCQPLAHTAHTRSKVVPVQPPVYSHHRRLNHPTFLAPGPLLLPPRLLAPRLTDTIRIGKFLNGRGSCTTLLFPPFFFFFQRVACFVLLLFLLFSFSIFERGGGRPSSLHSIVILRPCDSGLVLRQDLKEENNLLFFFWRRSVRRIRFLLNLIFNESSSRNIIINK